MRLELPRILGVSLCVALSMPAMAAPPTARRPAAAAPQVDPARARAALQAADAAIRAGQFDLALAELDRAAALDPQLDTVYLRRSGVHEQLAGPAASSARLQAASPSPALFRALAERLARAADDAEHYLELATLDATKRARVEARVADLRQRQRRAETLAAPTPPPPPPVQPKPAEPPPPPPPPPVQPKPAEPPPPPPAQTNKPIDPFADLETEPAPTGPETSGPAAPPQVEAPPPPPQVAVPARCPDSEPQPGPGLRIGGALATSVGVGMFGLGIAGVALGRAAEVEYETAPDLDARERADARGRTMNRLTITGFVSAVALIGVGATMLGIDATRRRRVQAAASLSATGGALVLHGSF